MGKIIRDPVHGYIHLNKLETNIINTKIFLRLQFIKQSPTSYLTYPSHYTNRFTHSLGVMEIAGRIARYALENTDPKTKFQFVKDGAKQLGVSKNDFPVVFVQLAKLTGLLHDIGHTPFSHQGENAISPHTQKIYGNDEDFIRFQKIEGGKLPKFHEFVSFCIIRDDKELKLILSKQDNFDYYRCLLKIFSPKTEGSLEIIKRIISDDIDADRADFLLRDSLSSGIESGHYDVMRLIESMVIYYDQKSQGYEILPSTMALSSVETFLVERYKMYKWLYYHPHVVLMDTILSEIMKKIVEYSFDKKNPIGKFLNIERFHHTKYFYNDEYFDDDYVLQQIKNIYMYLKTHKASSKNKLEYKKLKILIRQLLFREKHGKIILKNLVDYNKFDRELKEQMIKDEVPHCGNLNKCHFLLNSYALAASSKQLILKNSDKFDNILSDASGFVLEDYRAKFAPYEYDRLKSETKLNETEALTTFEYQSKYRLLSKENIPIPITDLSQSVKSLFDAWKNDMQCFIFVFSFKDYTKIIWPDIIAQTKNNMKNHLIKLWKDGILHY